MVIFSYTPYRFYVAGVVRNYIVVFVFTVEEGKSLRIFCQIEIIK